MVSVIEFRVLEARGPEGGSQSCFSALALRKEQMGLPPARSGDGSRMAQVIHSTDPPGVKIPSQKDSPSSHKNTYVSTERDS